MRKEKGKEKKWMDVNSAAVGKIQGCEQCGSRWASSFFF
jgi:hypothetical protein